MEKDSWLNLEVSFVYRKLERSLVSYVNGSFLVSVSKETSSHVYSI